MNQEVITGKIFSAYPELVSAMSTLPGGKTPFNNNLSFWVGDNEDNVKQNRDRFFGTLGIEQSRLAIPQQIHSDDVKIISAPGYYRNKDGLITAEKNIFMIVSTADCFPVLMYNPVKKIAAGIHSGWRGTQKGIAAKAIDMMKRELKCEPADIKIFTGPGISCEKFEVGRDVAELFEYKYVSNNEGKFFIDLKQNLTDQLRAAGIPDENMEVSDLCTYSEKDYLHSYRRDKNLSGRMFSVIGIRE
jgi:YfiH family protein